MHVLLVGIDNYGGGINPLNGCVNDIDAIQRILIDRLRIEPGAIRRLASPRDGTPHETDVPSLPASRENLLRALADLGGDRVRPDDRVFIYYSGHGVSLTVADGGITAAREGLVPVDASIDDQGLPHQLVIDLELNRLLKGIVQRTLQVTFILDCCHSAGATRDVFNRPGDATRSLQIEKPVPLTALGLQGTGGASGLDGTRGLVGGIQGSVNDCQVVAACLADEKALECDDDRGRKHGLLTQKLVTQLSALDPQELPSLRWGRIWRQVVAEVGVTRPQHPMLIGSFARPFFGGPPQSGDTGYGVTRQLDSYLLDVGELSGVTPGALVAVYGSTPASFPALDSSADKEARVGLLRVTRARRSSADAVAEAAPFDLPAGARARLVAAGETARISVSVIPPNDELEQKISASKRLRLAPVGETPVVSLVRRADGAWALTDTVHGTGEKPGEPWLVRIPAESMDQAVPLLEHYARYSEPLRMSELCTDLPSALQVSVLDCNHREMDDNGRLLNINPQVPDLPVVQAGSAGVFERRHEDLICLRVTNTSGMRLKVSLFTCASEGYALLLGEEVLQANKAHVFWYQSDLGVPFSLTVPEKRTVDLERFVAIGTTAVDKSLRHMDMDPEDRFERLLLPSRGDKSIGPPPRYPQSEKWTATRAIVRTSK